MTPTIVVGHYGSGKTEFAANYARWLLERGRNPIIADMDIVNPYFRLREKNEYYTKLGIKVVSSYYPGEHHLDAPALTAELRYCFETAEDSVIDVGGDANGAVVLARYAHHLDNRPYNMWLAVNANRPMTATPMDVMEYIDQIEYASKLKINGLLNTTHMLDETTGEDLERGDALVRQVAAERGLPVEYTVYLQQLESRFENLDLAGERFPIQLEIRPAWL